VPVKNRDGLCRSWRVLLRRALSAACPHISSGARRRWDTFSSQPRSRDYRWLFLRKAAAYSRRKAPSDYAH
jgi:hypothetical protein